MTICEAMAVYLCCCCCVNRKKQKQQKKYEEAHRQKVNAVVPSEQPQVVIILESQYSSDQSGKSNTNKTGLENQTGDQKKGYTRIGELETPGFGSLQPSFDNKAAPIDKPMSNNLDV